MSTLSDRQRRLLDQHCAAADAAIESDRRFFDRHRHRSYRVRHASVAEMQANGVLHGGDATTCPPGYRWFVIVRQIEDGVRLRNFVLAENDAETDMSDGDAEHVWRHLARPGTRVRGLEERMIAAIAKTRGAR